jgi:pyruvate,orthophosphate dikinase
MREMNEICSIDYLIGTLATAYRGLITSLIVKDFCMLEMEGSVVLKGTILSMPAGNYQASLIRQGTELDRSAVKEGYFEFEVGSGVLQDARNLQIDIVQDGRHIGTFLVKKESRDTFFTSALELSEDLRGVDFRLLTSLLREKPGLLENAEEIISRMLSSKKDWAKLSEKMNVFSKDLFWFDRNAYYKWLWLLTRWSVKACSILEGTNKPTWNLLFLVDLPLENEFDMQSLRLSVDMWLKIVADSSIDLSLEPKRSGQIFTSIREKLPDIDVKAVLNRFLEPVRNRITKAPAFSDSVIDALRGVIRADDLGELIDHSEQKRQALLRMIENARASLKKSEDGRVFEKVGELSANFLKDTEMVDRFYDIIERNMTREAARRLSDVLCGFFEIFDKLSSEAYARAMIDTVRVMRKLVSLNMVDVCGRVLTEVEKIIPSFRENIVLNPEFALSIIDTGDDKLLEQYKVLLKKILIPLPRVKGFSEETWAEIVNPLHLERLSKLLAILKVNSDKLKDVLIQTICNLYISGAFIPDDRIFQREVSGYLNSDTMRRNFLLSYMLLKKLPVYYSEVGASGRIRDDTTEIDSWGNDTVLYFLRKQVHANASNYNIYLVESIIRSWVYHDSDILRGVVPAEVLNKLDASLLNQYSGVIRPLFESLKIVDTDGFYPDRLLSISEYVISQRLEYVSASAAEEIKSKVLLICRIYREIVEKYSLLSGKIEGEDLSAILPGYVKRLKELKEIVTAPKKTQAEESLYFKRHIAFGIPSVMGSYHEPKFDALAEILSIEERLRVLFEEVISELDEKSNEFQISDVRWIYCLETINELLRIHDLSNFQNDEIVVIVKENELHLSQIVDMFKILQKELSWTLDVVSRLFRRTLVDILKIFPWEELPVRIKGLKTEGNNFVDKAADVVMRDIINSIGLVEFDRLLGVLIRAFTIQVQSGDDAKFVLTAKPEVKQGFFLLDELSDDEAMKFAPLIGNKAKNLAFMHNRDLLIPYGFVLPSIHTNDHQKYTESESFAAMIREVIREIEKRAGKIFGGHRRPLFLSVRSGSFVSMPGILSSILYCGMNRHTIDAFVEDTGSPWLAWDSYRRFIEHYGTIVFTLEEEVFERIFNSFMNRYGIAKKEDFKAEQMEEVTRRYIDELKIRNLKIPDDVYEQLKESVKAIYKSWFSERASQFKRSMNISEYWGTSVTVMQMIYGNYTGSGASVFFTRKPFSLEKGIYGETKECATGGDLVYGRLVNRPITRQQVFSDQKSLEEIDPELFLKHKELSERIEQAMRGLPQEVEATYTRRADGGRVIYVLQTRRMEFHRGFTKRFDDICGMESNLIGRAVGVFGGALSGVAAFSSSPARIRELREKFNLPVILLRREASTDDVSLMPEIDGIVTATGGATSHAAILAQKFSVTGVVSCSDMRIDTDEKGELYARIGGFMIKEGEHISIDGSAGLVYSGLCMSTVPAKEY